MFFSHSALRCLRLQNNVSQPMLKRVCAQTAVASAPSDRAQARKPSPQSIPSYPRVCVLGRAHTTLKWYLGRKANDSQLARAAWHVFPQVLELWGADSKTLQKREFVSKAAALPSELLPARRNLFFKWLLSPCATLH